jgi:hypothetical protein
MFLLKSLFSEAKSGSSAGRTISEGGEEVLEDNFFCENCGTKVSVDAIECPKCGMKFSG